MSSRSGSAQVVAVLALIVSLAAIIIALVAIMQVHQRPQPTVTESRLPAPAQPSAAPSPAAPSRAPSPPIVEKPSVSVQTPKTPPEPAAAPAPPAPTPAERSPFPAEGEVLARPIPAPRLAPEPVGPAPAEGQVVPWTQAKDHVGRTITVEGAIVDANNIGHITFLNFHEDWRDKFYIVVFEEAYADVPGGKPEDHYLNKTIRVTGEVSMRQGRPQMQVRDASQIEVIP